MIITIQSSVPLNQIWKISTLFPDCLQTSLENEHLRRGRSVRWCSNDEKNRRKKKQMSIMPLNETNHPFFRNSLSLSKTTTCHSSSVNCLFVSLSVHLAGVWRKRLSGIFSFCQKRIENPCDSKAQLASSRSAFNVWFSDKETHVIETDIHQKLISFLLKSQITCSLLQLMKSNGKIRNVSEKWRSKKCHPYHYEK